MAAATEELVPPKRIPVNGRRIRFRWLQQIIWAFLAANVGALIISALYYLIIQVRWHVGSHTFLYLKPDWDNLFHFSGWAADRHKIRDVYEAVLATLFVRSLLANWRKNDRRAPAWYVVLSPILIVVVAFPVVAAGIWLIDYALPYLWHARRAPRRHNPVHMPHPKDWLGTNLGGLPVQPAVIGILAGLVAHRVYAPAGNTVQLTPSAVGGPDQGRDRAGEENPHRHLPRWPWPPVIRERAAWIMQNNLPVRNRTRDIRFAVRVRPSSWPPWPSTGATSATWWPRDTRRPGGGGGRGDRGLRSLFAGQQEFCHRVGEAVRVLPEEQVAQLGEGHQPGPGDAVREQPAVARVDHGVRAAVQDQRAGPDALFLSPPAYRAPAAAWAGRPAGVAGPGPRSSRRRFTSSGWSRTVPRRQGVFRVAAPRRLGRHAGGRRDQPHGGGRHGIGEGPARCGARQDQTVDAFRVADRQFLGHHAAQARPQHVRPADARRHRVRRRHRRPCRLRRTSRRRSLRPTPGCPPAPAGSAAAVSAAPVPSRDGPGPSPGSGPATAAAGAWSRAARRRSATRRCGRTGSGSPRVTVSPRTTGAYSKHMLTISIMRTRGS